MRGKLIESINEIITLIKEENCNDAKIEVEIFDYIEEEKYEVDIFLESSNHFDNWTIDTFSKDERKKAINRANEVLKVVKELVNNENILVADTVKSYDL